jgi:hypothetical protein
VQSLRRSSNHPATATVLLSIAAVFALAAAPASALNVLLVMQDSTINAAETSRRTTFQSWGHTVTTIDGNAPQASFDTAMAAVDVVYVPSTVQEWELGTKVKSTAKGVVCEERYLDNEMGFSTGDGWNNSHNNIEVLNNTHPVTAGLATGYVTIVSSNQQITMMNPTVASEFTLLAKQNYAAGHTLGVMDVGAALAGGGTAAGRRVRLPWGDDNFSWAALNANGLRIAQQAITWAAADPLLLHWKLDSTNGTTAIDASTYGRTGTLSGSTSWTTGVRQNGLQLNSTGKVSVTNELGEPANFTIAGWARTDASDTHGAVLLSVGDCAALMAHQAASNSPAIAYWNGSSLQTLAASGGSRVGTGWHHYAATFNNATKLLTIYVDGVLRGSMTASGSPSYTIGTQTVAGDEATAYYNLHHTGSLDDLRVYNKVLTASEIVDLYGLVGHWKLDEAGGSTANDSSPKNNHAAFNAGSPVWTAGVRGSSLEFNGSSDLDTNTNFDPPAEGSVAFWFRFDDVPVGAQRLLGNGGDWEIRTDSTGRIYCDLSGDGVGAGFMTAAGVATAEEWHHLVAIYNCDADTYKVYLDGSLVASGSMTLADQPAAILTFGARTGSTERFDGTLDDVRVFAYELNPSQVADLYGLIGHWRLDATAGTTATDSSLKALHGTHTNGAQAGEFGPYPGDGQYAVGLDGGNDYVNGASTTDYPLTNTFSIGGWVRLDSHVNYAAMLENGSVTDSCSLTFSSTGQVRVMGRSGGGLRALTTTETLPLDTWKHVTATYDGTTYRIYIDGKLAGTSKETFTLDNASGNLTLGASLQGGDDFLDGSLHDVRFYNRAIDSSEVAKLHGLVGHWQLNEPSGNIAYDSSGMGKNGTYLGDVQLDQTGPNADLGSAEFLGFSGHVQLPTYERLFHRGFSMALWARPTSTGTWARFMDMGNGGGAYNLLFARRATSNDAWMDVYGGSLGTRGFGAANAIVNSKWQHYAVTVDSTGLATTYVDGEYRSSYTTGTPGDVVRTLNYIAKSNWSGDAYFQGNLSDVRLYNRAISAEEVQQAFGSGASGGLRIIRWVEAR